MTDEERSFRVELALCLKCLVMGATLIHEYLDYDKEPFYDLVRLTTWSVTKIENIREHRLDMPGEACAREFLNGNRA